MTRPERVRHVDSVLEQLYPEARLALRFESALQLLVAVILSAQCTDERVNAVTPALFARFPTARDLANAPQEALEALIRPTGFFRNKARLIRACCAQLVERFGGSVPQRVEELVTLPGVGRKTANMVAGNAFSVPGIAVDTHVSRVASRLGLSQGREPDVIEHDLCEALPAERWTAFANRMILFGRHVCHAKNPACSTCPFADWCPFLGASRGTSTVPVASSRRPAPPRRAATDCLRSRRGGERRPDDRCVSDPSRRVGTQPGRRVPRDR